MSKYLEDLNWRYAVKDFDSTKKVSYEDLNEIIEVFRLSPSSFGLQPWKLFIVENEDLKQEIMQNSWNQRQVGINSHLLVFAKPKEITVDLVERYLNEACEANNCSREDLKLYEEVLLGFINGNSKEQLDLWAIEQNYLALGNVMSFLANKKIDSCAIGGFNRNSINEILNLEEKGFESVVMLPIGYRSENDKYSQNKKVRFHTKDIYEIIK